MRFPFCLLGLYSLLTMSCSVMAQTRVLTFDEIPSQSVDNLSIGGVTFHYTIGGIASPNATYNTPGLGTLTYLDDPVLEGDANGVLAFDFDIPTTVVDFGVARSSIDPLASGAMVTLFDTSLQQIGNSDVSTEPLILFSEGLFQYSGSPVKRVEITFPDPVLADAFALDNLTFQVSSANVPEPNIFNCFAAGMIAISVARLRFKRKSECKQSL